MRHPLIIRAFRARLRSCALQAVAALVSAPLVCGNGALLAQTAATEDEPKLSAEQLEALVAPIALYPDTLLAQCLVASTYPLDVVAAQQWLDKHKNLKGDELAQAAMNEKWDPSVQALVGLPDALKRLSENIEWTDDLGNAFLAQQSELMDAVQRLRGKAKDSGKLDSSEQQKVETKVVEDKNVVIIEPSNPEVVYVPSYSPAVVWGAPPYYPYPPLYYPPYYGGAWLGFGVGIAIGIGIAGGWGCGWGGNNTININNNNNFVSHYNRQNNISGSGNANWKHNAQQRGGAPYGNKATANKYGGTARSDSPGSRGGGPGASTRDAGGRGGGGGSSFGSGGGSSYGGGGDRVGSRDVGGGASHSGFSGSSGGSRGASASSSRGSSSFGGGGMRGGGGGRRR